MKYGVFPTKFPLFGNKHFKWNTLEMAVSVFICACFSFVAITMKRVKYNLCVPECACNYI